MTVSGIGTRQDRAASGNDVITRLRCIYREEGCNKCTFCAAKSEIERLRAEVARRG